MKVYVITCGKYENYHIEAVSLDRKKAELICAKISEQCLEDICNIEEYDTEDIEIEDNLEIRYLYYMRVAYKTGEILKYAHSIPTINDSNGIKVRRSAGYKKFNVIEVKLTFKEKITEDKAKEIILDKIEKFKAERRKPKWILL